LSKSPVKSSNELIKSIHSNCLSFLGELGFAKAGLMFLKDKYNPKLQKGIIKVNNKYINHLKAVVALVKKIDNQNVIISSVGVSGILKKAEKMMV
jgi:RNase P/RNase MRP subunit POP5